MKFKYVPGMRPTPMLMYYKEVNEKVFNEENLNEDSKIYKKGEFTQKFNHIWNMGSYFIYDDNQEIISYRITNNYNFLWLLRVINQEIIVEFNQDFVKENQDFFKEISEELITV